MNRLLIVGANSFIGNAVSAWLTERYQALYEVDMVEAKNGAWQKADFSKYDTVFQVAGIAHVPKETPEMHDLFFDINATMTGEIAAVAKKAGVHQYIFMSTKGVYPSFVPVIDKTTKENPPKLYGKSKLAGEKKLQELESDQFLVSIIRPPAVYGRNAPGSFNKLIKQADTLRVFPAYKNERSMLYIDNLCEFIHIVINRRLRGILVPQDARYVCTSNIIRVVARIKKRAVMFDYLSWPIISLLVRTTYKGKKIFGNTVYVHDFSVPDKEYNVVDFETAVNSIVRENEL